MSKCRRLSVRKRSGGGLLVLRHAPERVLVAHRDLVAVDGLVDEPLAARLARGVAPAEDDQRVGFARCEGVPAPRHNSDNRDLRT